MPRGSVRFPVAMVEPAGFRIEHLESWPRVPGRVEYVGGRLWFMPPCGEVQQRVAADVSYELGAWQRSHGDFVVGGNEAGMLLGGEVRGADAAVWHGARPAVSGFARVAPILAVEIVGQDEDLNALVEKAEWYLSHGTSVVWIVDPTTRRVYVVTSSGTLEVADRIPESPLLPGLSPVVADFFRQL